MVLHQLFKRLLYAIPTLWIMVSLIFLLSRVLPGAFGEQQLLMADESFYGKGSAQQRTAAYEQLLNRTNQQLPLFYISIAPILPSATADYSYLLPDFEWHGSQNQYHLWASQLLKGSLGVSFASNRAVADSILEAAGNTIWILLASMVAAIALALVLSISMVQHNRTHWRRFILSFLIVLDSLPLFVLSLLLLLLLANPDALQIFPAFGLSYGESAGLTGFQKIAYDLPYFILPILTLVLAEIPYLTNQLYNALNTSLQSDYIRTARAKGLSERTIILKHALRNALLPVITVLSDLLPVLVAGTIIIETIFAIPGVGRLLVSSVLARDFPVIVGIVVVIALVKMLSHILADVLYTIADPRIKHKAA